MLISYQFLNSKLVISVFYSCTPHLLSKYFFFNDKVNTEIYTRSASATLHLNYWTYATLLPSDCGNQLPAEVCVIKNANAFEVVFKQHLLSTLVQLAPFTAELKSVISRLLWANSLNHYGLSSLLSAIINSVKDIEKALSLYWFFWKGKIYDQIP